MISHNNSKESFSVFNGKHKCLRCLIIPASTLLLNYKWEKGVRNNIFSGRNQATFFCFAWVQELTHETQSLTKYHSTLCGQGLGPLSLYIRKFLWHIRGICIRPLFVEICFSSGAFPKQDAGGRSLPLPWRVCIIPYRRGMRNYFSTNSGLIDMTPMSS